MFGIPERSDKSIRNYFPLPRDLLKHPAWTETTQCERALLFWLCLSVRTKPHGNTPRGCIDISQRQLAAEMSMNRNALGVAIRRLVEIGVVVTERGSGGTTRFQLICPPFAPLVAPDQVPPRKRVSTYRRHHIRCQAGTTSDTTVAPLSVPPLLIGDLRDLRDQILSTGVDGNVQKQDPEPLQLFPPEQKQPGRKRTPKAKRDPKPAKPPLPFTIAELIAAFHRGAGKAFAADSWDPALAKTLTALIRRLGDAGKTLADVETAGRWVATTYSASYLPLSVGWLAKTGNVFDVLAKCGNAPAAYVPREYRRMIDLGKSEGCK